MTAFFDTSAFLKLYHEEQGSASLSTFIENQGPDLVRVASAIVEVELFSAFMQKVRLRELEEDEVREILSLCVEDIGDYRIIEFGQSVFKVATELLVTHASSIPLRSLDAIQLASAIVADRDSKVERFISSDKHLLLAAQFYLPTFNPELEVG